MKLFTVKTNKADLLNEANDLLQQREVLVYLLVIVFTFAILF
jgi:hypothetical protein